MPRAERVAGTSGGRDQTRLAEDSSAAWRPSRRSGTEESRPPLRSNDRWCWASSAVRCGGVTIACSAARPAGANDERNRKKSLAFGMKRGSWRCGCLCWGCCATAKTQRENLSLRGGARCAACEKRQVRSEREGIGLWRQRFCWPGRRRSPARGPLGNFRSGRCRDIWRRVRLVRR